MTMAPLSIVVTYSATGVGLIYFSALFYYMKKNWDSVFAGTYNIVTAEIID